MCQSHISRNKKRVICKSKFQLGVEFNLTNSCTEINLTNKNII